MGHPIALTHRSVKSPHHVLPDNHPNYNDYINTLKMAPRLNRSKVGMSTFIGDQQKEGGGHCTCVCLQVNPHSAMEIDGNRSNTKAYSR